MLLFDCTKQTKNNESIKSALKTRVQDLIKNHTHDDTIIC